MWLLDKLLGKKGKTESKEVTQTDPSDLELSYTRLKAQPKQVIVKEEVKANPVEEKVVGPVKETVNKYEEEFKNKIGFNVAGVTQENEEGKDIQAILKRVANGYKNGYSIDSFQGYSTSELKEWYEDSHISEFEGEYLDDVLKFVPEPDNQYDKNAIKVYLNDHNGVDQHIGYVKKAVNKKLLDFIHRDMIDSTTIEFVGGKTKYINYDYLDDKSTIETRELTRGVSVIITVKEDIQAERNVKGKELEKEGNIEEAKRLYLLRRRGLYWKSPLQ